MVFINFIKQAKYTYPHERIQFFSSTQPYLNNNSLAKYYEFFTQKWHSDGPHPSSANRNFLGIDTGHYGMYYTMYNYDADRRKSSGTPYQAETLLTFILHHEEPIEGFVYYDYTTKFLISRINQDILTNIEKISKKFFSAIAKFPAKSNFLFQVRCFSTSHARRNQEEEKIREEIELSNEKETTFEEQLLETQTSRIMQIYSASSSPEDLNIIYPLYQTLRRNNLAFANIEHYNVVLKSIVKRSLDSDNTKESIEAKLTNLMTVYEDILSNSVKPSHETYDIILLSLFEGSENVIVNSKHNSYIHDSCKIKSAEFGKIGLDLFNSISDYNKLNIDALIFPIFEFLNRNSHFSSKPLLKKLLNNICLEDKEAKFYISILENSKNFSKLEIFATKEELYDFINSVYHHFKSSHITSSGEEYLVYSKLIETLIHNDFPSLASKFLDKILTEYRSSIHNEGGNPNAQISSVISAFIKAFIDKDNGSSEKAFDFLVKFNSFPYLPEVTNVVFNDLILEFVDEFNDFEHQKSQATASTLEEMKSKQQVLYDRIWYLYEYVAIRKDYQASGTVSLLEQSSKSSHCRDALISLCINLGDHARVFQLIKETLLKNHLIYDLNSLQKLLNYLNNGVVYNANGEMFNQYYFGLLWSVLASQSVHYVKDSNQLNAFLSEFVHYLQIPSNGRDSPEFIEYSVRFFMNSTMIQEAINHFNLQTDNIYGLYVVSKVLMTFNQTADLQLLQKILSFQSKLFNLFEDTENFYVELDADLTRFKQELAGYIRMLINSVNMHNAVLTKELIEALKIMDIHLPNDTELSEKADMLIRGVNLSYLLNVNYKCGAEKFVELFKKGYTFSSNTWSIMLNYNFVHEHMKKARIDTMDLMNRLLLSDFDTSQKIEHLRSFMAFQNDSIAIKLIKFLRTNGRSLLEAEKKGAIVCCLLDFVADSKNVYLKNLATEEETFEVFYECNENKDWAAKFFNLLRQRSENERIVSLVEQYDFDLSNMSIFEVYASALLDSRNEEKFMIVFQKHAPITLSESSIHVELLMNYYLLQDDINGINLLIEKLGAYRHLSEKTNESFLLAKAIKSMTSRNSGGLSNFEASTIKSTCLLLLNCNLRDMKKVIAQNQSLLSNRKSKTKLMDMLVSNLLQISTYSIVSAEEVVLKFQAIIRLFKHLNLRTLTTQSLLNVISMLTMTRSKDTLKILITKLINGEQCTDIVDFFFLETDLSAKEDKRMILSHLSNCLMELDDPMNAAIVANYSQNI